MNSTTLKMDQLGQAKKIRNEARQKLFETIQKIVDTLGCSEFEALHAVTDSVTQTIHGKINTYGTHKADLSAGLAQTWLPETDAMANKNEVAPSPVGLKSSTLDFKWTLPSPTLKAKADKDVTEADVPHMSVINTFSGPIAHSLAKQYIQSGETLNPSSHLLLKKKYVTGVGYVYDVYGLLKSSPYMKASVVNQFKAPPHYKWKKVYNKPFCKLVVDPKNPPNGKTAQYNGKTLKTYDHVLVETAVNIQPAPGYHWETYYGNNKEAVYLYGGADTYMYILQAHPEYAFPPQWWKDENPGVPHVKPWGEDDSNTEMYKASPSGW